jgi:hypothetical protein
MRQAKIRPKPVLNSTSLPHQTESGSAGRTVRIEWASNQVPGKDTHHTLNSSFLYIFKLCFPTSDLLAQYGPQAPTDLTCLVYRHIRTPTL